MDLSGFGGNFTATLAAGIVQHAWRYLDERAFGSEETGALADCFSRALAVALTKVQAKDLLATDSISPELESVLTTILHKEATAKALIAAALEGERPEANCTRLLVD